MSELTIRAGWTNQAVGEQLKMEETGKQNEKKAYFAGNLNLADNPVEQKRKEAREMAWNVVKNVWDTDKEVDNMVKERENHAAEMQKWQEESVKALSKIEDEKSALSELYGVEADSAEQKDLELLERRQDIQNGVIHERLTPEEEKRLSQIDEKPLTEYQERALELNKRAARYKNDFRQAELERRDDESDVRSIEEERLKSHAMLDAQKQAEEIQKAANEDVIGMLVQDATDHIDEIQEEAEKKEKEEAEKTEEREEKREEIELQRAVQQAVIEGSREAVECAEARQRRNDAPDMEVTEMLELTEQNQKNMEVQESLNEIKYSMKVLEADLKGIKVDEEV